MELYQIRYFIAVARLLHFTRAAEQCNVTQPALTKAIQKLEQALGGPLIHRERRHTQLTDLGKLVLPMLERVYSAAESVRISAEEFQRREIAPLKLGIASCVSAALVEAPLAEIAKLMPGLQVELVELEPGRIVERLLSGEANAAIAGDSLGELPPRMDRWRLFEEEFAVLMPLRSNLAAHAAVGREALIEADWLAPAEGYPARDPLREIFPPDVEPRVSHRCHQLEHFQHLVSAGLGLMLWPEHAPHAASLTTRPIVGGGPRRVVQLLVVAGRRYSPALEALVRIARVRDWRRGFPALQAPDAPSRSLLLAAGPPLIGAEPRSAFG